MSTERRFGTWWSPKTRGNEIPGQIEWEQPRSPVVSLLQQPQNLPISLTNRAGELRLPLSPDESVSMLHGNLAHHGGVTVLQGRSAGFELAANVTDKIRFNFAVLGIHLGKADEKFIRRVEIDMPSISPLLGLRPIKAVPDQAGNAGAIAVSIDGKQHQWTMGDIRIEWIYRDVTIQSLTSLTVSMRPIVILTSSRPKSLDYWIHEWVLPIFQFTTFAAGVYSRMRSIELWTKKHLTPMEHRGLALPLWMSGIGESEIPGKRPIISVESIDSNPEGLPGVVSRYRELASKQDVFLEQLWQGIRNEDRPVHNRYLDLISGLESYHSREYGEAPVSQDEYKRRRKEVYSEINDKLIAGDRKFIKEWLPSRAYYGLPTRLRAIGRELSLGAWRIEPEDLAKLRNDIAHGNPIRLSDVRDAYEEISTLARRLILKNLGISF
jgi:hypothetical protein